MRLLVLEFNELSPVLMERFIQAGHLPNFARLQRESLVTVTDAGESPPNLEPWIQWVTAHTGLSYAEHGCFNLNDGSSLEAPRVWDHVCRAGGTAVVCGSMNARFEPESFKGYFLPDPWATDVTDHPKGEFAPYLDVVRKSVQEHSGGAALGAGALAKFGLFMARHGLSASTVLSALKQLAGEKKTNASWRRALILDRLQWDLFSSLYKSAKPDIATFFSNSTAHFQHFHWRELEPELFTVQPSDKDRETYGSAVLDGYRNMDRIVGQAMALAGPDTAIVFCTALSQQPMLTHEETGGRQIFRHRDIAEVMEFAGVTESYEYAPIMSQQFLLHFTSEEEARSASAKIEALRLDDGRQLMWARVDGTSIDAGCMIESPSSERFVTSPVSNETKRFDDMFYPLHALRSGMHHPEGIFWIKAPGVAPRRMEETVPLTAVAPTLLHLAGVQGGTFSQSSILQKDAELQPA